MRFIGTTLCVVAIVFSVKWLMLIMRMGPKTRRAMQAKTPLSPEDADYGRTKWGLVYNKKENRLELRNCGLTQEGLDRWNE